MAKKRMTLFGSVLCALLFCCSQGKKLDNVFYCFNNGVRTMLNAPQGYEEPAALVKRLGYDGLAGHGEETYYAWRAALDKVGLEMPEIYIAMNIKDGKISQHPDLSDILRHSHDRNLLVALHLHADSSVTDKARGDSLFVRGLRDLADLAAPLRVQIAVYPHADLYCETLHHAVELARKTNRRNVGATLNLCHLLKVEGEQGWEQKTIAALPWLFMVSIHGADSGDTRAMGWDRLIRPLGEGSFDVYKLVKLLKDNGYKGKFGLQCYKIQQDCETALTKSITTWRQYQQRYARGE
ncbi:MAG TPA: TIM barrel protein [bacterium]|nr:TIM barrel protein [bacterium]HPN34906.1 TIM barrel protein [bacterium]